MGVCVVVGLGSEVVVGHHLMTTNDRMTPFHEHLWFVAQFVFPLMILCAVLFARVQNPFSLIFGVVGMWKFGFPETLAYTSHGILSMRTQPIAQTVSDIFNAWGCLIHHSASMLFMCIFTFGLGPLDRTVFNMTIPLVIQHVVVGIKYLNMPVYVMIELAIEVWWQLAIFSNMERLYQPHGVPPSRSMVFTNHSQLQPRGTCAM